MMLPIARIGDSLELRVTLREIDPPVWRRIVVPAHLTLGELHQALQTSFGWSNSHLHDFLIGDARFGMTGVETDGMFEVPEDLAPLGAVVRAGSTFVYTYDFGDDWEHTVEVVAIVREPRTLIECLDGARACPPEDSGGPYGYASLLEALADPAHPEHRELKRWVPRGFDAEKFDLAAVNKKLATLSKRWERRLALGRSG